MKDYLNVVQKKEQEDGRLLIVGCTDFKNPRACASCPEYLNKKQIRTINCRVFCETSDPTFDVRFIDDLIPDTDGMMEIIGEMNKLHDDPEIQKIIKDHS